MNITKISRTFFLGIIALLLFFNIDGSYKVLASETSELYDSWGDAYYNKLMSYTDREDFEEDLARFELFDVNSDGIPELFISSGNYHMAEVYIYTFKDGQPISLDNGAIVGTWGVVDVVPSKSYIILSGGVQGKSWIQIYEFNGREMTEIGTLENTMAAVSADYYGYKFNNKKISKDQYDQYYKQYTSDSISGVGRDQKFDELSFVNGNLKYINYLEYCVLWTVNDSTLTSINVPATVKGLPVKGIELFASGNTNIKEVTVNSNNEYLTSIDGVVFNKAKTKLLYYPPAKFEKNYSVPSDVNEIGDFAFYGSLLTSIIVPENVVVIREGAFNSQNLTSITFLNPDCDIFDYYDDSDPFTISNGFDDDTQLYYYAGVIKGYDNSIAQIYSEHYGIKFESLGSKVSELIPVSTELEKSKCLLGDFNLDGKVTQVDATLMLRYLLESSISTDKSNIDIVYDLVKNAIADDLKSESKEQIYVLVMKSADVDCKEEGKLFSQTDATFILRALLISNNIDNAFWEEFFKEQI